MKQLTFASLSYELKKKQTRRERFLLEMEQVVPWDALLAVVEPFYPKSDQPARQREACKAGPWWAGEAADSSNYEQREHKTQRRTANRHCLNPTTPPVTTSAAFCITWIMRGRNRLENSRPL